MKLLAGNDIRLSDFVSSYYSHYISLSKFYKISLKQSNNEHMLSTFSYV